MHMLKPVQRSKQEQNRTTPPPPPGLAEVTSVKFNYIVVGGDFDGALC